VAHQALETDPKGGRPKTVRAGQKTVRVGHTITEFIKSVGMARSTFYDFIKRMNEMMDSGINLLELPADMKLVEAAAPKSQAEVELEEKIAEQGKELTSREKAAEEYKEGVKEEHAKVLAANKTIKTLKEKAEKQAEPDPELLKKIGELEKRQAKLEKEVDWYDTAVSFKTEMTVLLDHLNIVNTLGKKVLSAKKPK